MLDTHHEAESPRESGGGPSCFSRSWWAQFVVVFFIYPETKGVTLEKLQEQPQS